MGLEIQVLLHTVSLWHYIDVSYQLHTPVGLAQTKHTQVTFEEETDWTAEAV